MHAVSPAIESRAAPLRARALRTCRVHVKTVHRLV